MQERRKKRRNLAAEPLLAVQRRNEDRIRVQQDETGQERCLLDSCEAPSSLSVTLRRSLRRSCDVLAQSIDFRFVVSRDATAEVVSLVQKSHFRAKSRIPRLSDITASVPVATDWVPLEETDGIPPLILFEPLDAP